MRTIMERPLLSLIAAGALSAAARADGWTGPKDVSKSAHEFACAAERLQKAIKDINENSPLVVEVRSRSKSAAQLRDSVAKGGHVRRREEEFSQDRGRIRPLRGGEKAHDIHHERPVADAAKKVEATFDQLQALMSGRRPTDKTD